ARSVSRIRPCTKGSAFRCSRQWPAAFPSLRAAALRWTKSRTEPLSWSTLSTRRRSRKASSAPQPSATGWSPPACRGPAAFGGARGGGDARGKDRRDPRGDRVTKPVTRADADGLARRRTGDETYVRELLRPLPAVANDLRIAAVTRDPALLPEGVEPVHLPAG